MKDLAIFKLPFLVMGISIGITGCAVSQYSQPSDLRFQGKSQEKNQIINVKRDDKLCASDTLENQNCPINFYIDSVLAGKFYVNNSANYYLKDEVYNFKVKNCTSEECQSCDIDLQPNRINNNDLMLSIDSLGKPFITYAGKALECQ